MKETGFHAFSRLSFEIQSVGRKKSNFFPVKLLFVSAAVSFFSIEMFFTIFFYEPFQSAYWPLTCRVWNSEWNWRNLNYSNVAKSTVVRPSNYAVKARLSSL